MKSLIVSSALVAVLLPCSPKIALAGPPPGGYPDDMHYPNIIHPEITLGGYGTNLGQFLEPSRVTFGSDNRIYVTECDGNRVQIFTSEGVPAGSWGTDLSATLNCPDGIAITNDGRAFVVDSRNHRIVVFDEKGKILNKWGKFGAENGQFKAPSGVTVDSGRVYVADPGNQRIQVFDLEGQFLMKLPAEKDKFLICPVAVAVDDRGFIHVADSDQSSIVTFTHEGKWSSARV